MTSPYRFRDIPLTGSVFAALVPQVMRPDEVVTRGDLLDRVRRFHRDHGGLEPVGSAMSVAKKGLADLQRTGDVESAGTPGYWRRLPDEPASDADVDPRLVWLLDVAAREWGARGVLAVARKMWPDAA